MAQQHMQLRCPFGTCHSHIRLGHGGIQIAHQNLRQRCRNRHRQRQRWQDQALPGARIDDRHPPQPEGHPLDQHDAQPKHRYGHKQRRQRLQQCAHTLNPHHTGRQGQCQCQQQGDGQPQSRQPQRWRQVGSQPFTDRYTGLQRIPKISCQKLAQRMQVLAPCGLIRSVGGLYLGNLIRSKAQIRVEELDQHRIAWHQLQQHKRRGKRGPQHQQSLTDAA